MKFKSGSLEEVVALILEKEALPTDKEDLQFAYKELKDSRGPKLLAPKNNGVFGKNGGFSAKKQKSQHGEEEIFVLFILKTVSGWLSKRTYFTIERSPDDKRWSFSVFTQDKEHLAGSRVAADKVYNDITSPAAKMFTKFDPNLIVPEVAK